MNAPGCLVLFGLLLLAATPGLCEPDCPTLCRCKWISGKKSALCMDAGFTAIPSSLDSEMQLLDLAGNDIPYLIKDAFRSVGLINLQRIFMRGTGVREVHRDAFRELRILLEVDLSDNAISSLHPDTFNGNDHLRILSLNGNPIVELQDAQFPSLPHLRNLQLQDCQLRRIHKNSFVNLASLETLNLNGNQLRQLSEQIFVPISHLKTLMLYNNPWRCDCELREFRNWLLSSKLYSIPLTCMGADKLKGRFWEDVESSDFACAPEVSLSENIVQEEVGGNVTFQCHVSGDPEPEVAWLFNGKPIGVGNKSNPDLMFLVEEEQTFPNTWTNLSIFNISDQEAGDYSCVAWNTKGGTSRNVSLILPHVVAATTFSKAEGWLLWTGIVVRGVVTLCSALLTVVCSC